MLNDLKLLKRLRNMEPERGVQRFVRDNHILMLRIDRDTARILQQQVRSADGEPGRGVAVIEDAPYADEVLQSESASDVVSKFTAGASRTNDREDHSSFRIRRH